MATFTTLPNSAVAAGGLPSGETVTALRDNPIAIAEGDVSAPRISPKALDLYLGALDVADTTASGLTGLNGLDTIMVFVSANFAGSSRLQFSLSDDGGSTWGAWFDNILIAGNAVIVDSTILISLKSARLFRVSSTTSSVNSGRDTSYTIPGSGANAIRFRFATAGGNVAEMEIFGMGTFA